ncbi:MAG: hypothetical protein WAR23_00280, partial [Dethiobacteria bacterium]
GMPRPYKHKGFFSNKCPLRQAPGSLLFSPTSDLQLPTFNMQGMPRPYKYIPIFNPPKMRPEPETVIAVDYCVYRVARRAGMETRPCNP